MEDNYRYKNKEQELLDSLKKYMLNTLEEDNNKNMEDKLLGYAVLYYLINKNTDIENLDAFSEIDSAIDNAKRTFLNIKGIEKQNQENLYLNYNFVENILSTFIQSNEGEKACSIKAKSVLKKYNRLLSDKNIREIDNSKWYHPNVGNNTDWIPFVEIILNLSVGEENNFSHKKNKVLSLYGKGENNKHMK